MVQAGFAACLCGNYARILPRRPVRGRLPLGKHTHTTQMTAVLLAVVVVAAAAAAAAEEVECDLSCWLRALTVTVPDQQFNTQAVGWFNVSNVTCSGITVGGTASGVDAAGDSVALGAWGIELKCSGEWTYKYPVRTHHGSLTAAVNDSSLNATLFIPKDSEALPIAANLTACAARVHFVQLHFVGDSRIVDVLDQLENETEALLGAVLNDVACVELKELVEANVTQALRDASDALRPLVAPPVPRALPLVPPGTLSLVNNAFVNTVDFLLDDLIGVEGANKIANALTTNTGQLQLPVALAVQVPVANFGVVSLELRQIAVSGLNTWGEMDMLEPESTYSLASRALLRSLAVNISFAVSVALNSTLLRDPYILVEEGVISVQITNGSLASSVQIAVEPQTAVNYTNAMCTDPACVAALLYADGTTVTRLDAGLGSLRVLLQHPHPQTQTDTDLAGALCTAATSVLVATYAQCAPQVARGVAAGPALSALNAALSAALHRIASFGQHCEYEPDVKPASEQLDPTWTLCGFSAAIAIAAIVTAGGLAASAVQRHRRKCVVDPEKAALLLGMQEQQKPVDEDDVCLLLHPRINVMLRFAMPLLIAANAALFLVSNTSGGATVHLVVDSATGRVISLPSMFVFTLANSVKDMWEAGIWPLALLVAGFSGAWPYLKLVLMFAAWVTPTRVLPVKYREYALMLLDALGKWSMLDSYMMIMFMVAFHLKITFPVHDPEHTELDGPLTFAVLVRPLPCSLARQLSTSSSHSPSITHIIRR
eukprot:TRINITY_DN119_c2_g1_i1.p1 TRINITY_DN119_c2_g1~~TRINITY_DN119_c2_g1_i1.p1  ORF type:complete len:772 (-),score=159.08 TRINITY_DN119_c2_g1_i1:973-3288(-)